MLKLIYFYLEPGMAELSAVSVPKLPTNCTVFAMRQVLILIHAIYHYLKMINN